MLLVNGNIVIKITNTRLAFTCSKLTAKTPEQGAKHVQNQQ